MANRMVYAWTLPLALLMLLHTIYGLYHCRDPGNKVKHPCSNMMCLQEPLGFVVMLGAC